MGPSVTTGITAGIRDAATVLLHAPRTARRGSAKSSGAGFYDGMSTFNKILWQKAHGWANGDPLNPNKRVFNVGWRSDKITFRKGVMTIQLDRSGCPSQCSKKPFVSGELRSKRTYLRGLLEARMKAAKSSGTTSTLFFYTGKWGTPSHHEIDIEIFGKNPRTMQVNYYASGKGKHEKIIKLGFDASKAFHTYAIRWAKRMIVWYVDGKPVHCVSDKPARIPHRPAKIMMSLWAGINRKDIVAWLGRHTYRKPVTTQYDWVRYTPASRAPALPTRCP